MIDAKTKNLVNARRRQLTQAKGNQVSESSRIASCGCVWNYYVHGHDCPEHGVRSATTQEIELVDAINLLREVIRPTEDTILAVAIQHEQPSTDGRYYDAHFQSPEGYWKQTPVNGGSWKWRPNEEKCRTVLKETILREFQ